MSVRKLRAKLRERIKRGRALNLESFKLFQKSDADSDGMIHVIGKSDDGKTKKP